MDLRSCDAALDVGFLQIVVLQIACVELDLVRKDAAVVLVLLVHKGLLDGARIVLLPLRHQALAYLLERVLRVFVPGLHLRPLGNALLAVATHGDAVLTLDLLLLAPVNGLIDAVLLLLVFDLQVVLPLRVHLRVGARSH